MKKGLLFAVLMVPFIGTFLFSASQTFAFVRPRILVVQSRVLLVQSPNNSQLNNAFNSAANFRLTMNSLLKEHTVLAVTMLSKLYKGEDTTRLDQLMVSNGNQLTRLVQREYGSNAASSFSQLWTAHMQEYKNYTVAKRNNDTVGMSTARSHLQTIAVNLGNLFGRVGRNLPSSTVTNLMMQHINGTLAFVDATANNDNVTAANLMKMGYDQAGQFADTLAHGMILDRPQLYQ